MMKFKLRLRPVDLFQGMEAVVDELDTLCTDEATYDVVYSEVTLSPNGIDAEIGMQFDEGKFASRQELLDTLIEYLAEQEVTIAIEAEEL